LKDFQARVYVRLKPSVHDPQGETIRGALETMGYRGVKDVRQGKYFEMSVKSETREQAEAMVREIANRILSNPVIETFQVDVVE
jgi:phosphoribosylformylglycinamidine synthase subunit PurS